MYACLSLDIEFQNYLDKKYGNNKWWKSDDDLVIAYHQINEDRLAVRFNTFHKAVESVLGRPVWTHQFASKKTLEQVGLLFDPRGEGMWLEKMIELINKKWSERN